MGKRLEAAPGHCVKGNKKTVVNHYSPVGGEKKKQPIVFYYSAKSTRKEVGDLSRWNPHHSQHPNLLSLECQFSDQMILLSLIILCINAAPESASSCSHVRNPICMEVEWLCNSPSQGEHN